MGTTKAQIDTLILIEGNALVAQEIKNLEYILKHLTWRTRVMARSEDFYIIIITL